MNPWSKGPVFETRVSEAGDVVIFQVIMRAACIFPDPTFDAVRKIRKDVGRFLDEGRRIFVIDISSIDWVDSSCLGELVAVWQQVRGSTGVLKVILNRRVSSLWTRIGLEEMVSASGSLGDTVAEANLLGHGK